MVSSGNGQPLMDVVLRFFQEDQWHYQIDNLKSAARAGHRGERGTWICHAKVDQKNQRFLFYTMMGVNIPVEYRGPVAEYLTRVNHHLTLGSFEMNMDTGDIRFRVGVVTPEGELSVAMVRAMAYASVRSMDLYFPGVLSVVHGGLSPEAALARVEAQPVEQE